MDLVLFLIVVITLLVAFSPIYNKCKKQIEFQNLINKIPGPKAYPIFGTTLAYITAKREGNNFLA